MKFGETLSSLERSVLMPSLAPSSGSDWTDEERREIDRLHEACEGGKVLTLECGHTDAGDPWCVICDVRDGTVLFHIARISRRYVVAKPMQATSFWTATLGAAIDRTLLLMSSGALGRQQ
jgi:hypothetical protein